MPSFKNKPIHDSILEFSKQSAILNLLESGVDANYIEPMLEIMNSSVATGGDIDDLVDELKVFILGDKTGLGALDRYTSQVSRDSLMQFSATYDEILNEDIGLEFYQYIGTSVKDTRPFCNAFLNGYFHREEVKQLGNGIDPITGRSLGAAGLLEGRIRGTNGSNIFINRGGWNCRHRFLGVNTQFVPQNVLQRNLDKGNWQPNKAQLEAVGLI